MTSQTNTDGLAALSDKLKATINHLYDLEVTAADYPVDAESLIGDKLRTLVTDFKELDEFPDTGVSVPQDVLEYIEAGRNPNVYTRQFSEAVTKESQSMYGKMTAHQDFAKLLGEAISDAFPELSSDVARAQRLCVDVK